jgi:hypothetical protein
MMPDMTLMDNRWTTKGYQNSKKEEEGERKREEGSRSARGRKGVEEREGKESLAHPWSYLYQPIKPIDISPTPMLHTLSNRADEAY